MKSTPMPSRPSSERKRRRLPVFETRVARHGQEAICGECNACTHGKWCAEARTPELRKYTGIRLTADGFDCALPVTIDSHSHCSYECAYCFSESLVGHVAGRSKGLGEQSLGQLDRIFGGGGGQFGATIRNALRYDRRNSHGFPCPVQLGGVNDPGDSYERQRGWLLEFIKLAIKHEQPVRISTKGTVLQLPEYQRELAKAPHLFWVAFSIITPDDALLARIDAKAPNATERLEVMRAMSALGCKTSLRFRPIMPGVSDRTPRYPRAYQTLIELAADAGARAVSAEVAFVPTRFNVAQRKRWDRMEGTLGVPLGAVYKQLGKHQACMRAGYRWTEDIMHSIREVTHANGMTLGVSDPLWKQLTDVGCCCGIDPADPVFGNWEPENATNALLRAKRDPKLVLTLDDITPPWARSTLKSLMSDMGAGPRPAFAKRHHTWADFLAKGWNDLTSQRGPLSYFQGALEPVDLPDGQRGYRYVGLQRAHPASTPYWRTLPPVPRAASPLDVRPTREHPQCNACGSAHTCAAHRTPEE